MKKIWKKLCVWVLTLTLLTGITGCSSADKTWAAKDGDLTIPIGAYIYLLAVSYNEAASQVEDSEADVLKQTIDDLDAETWIRNRAKYYMDSYFAVARMAAARDLSLTEEEQAAVSTEAAYYFNQNTEMMKELGVALSSYTMIPTEQSYLKSALFLNLYGKGGEYAVSDEELQTYFESSYTYYHYILQYPYVTDEEGNLVVMSEDEMEEIRKEFEGYVTAYNNGEKTMEEIAAAYEEKGHYQFTLTEDSAALTESVSIVSEDTAVGESLSALDSGKAAFVDSDDSSSFYLLFQHDISEKTEEWLTTETNRNQLLSALKEEEFEQKLDAEIEALSEITYNEKLMNGQKLATIVKAISQ